MSSHVKPELEVLVQRFTPGEVPGRHFCPFSAGTAVPELWLLGTAGLCPGRLLCTGLSGRQSRAGPAPSALPVRTQRALAMPRCHGAQVCWETRKEIPGFCAAMWCSVENQALVPHLLPLLCAWAAAPGNLLLVCTQS